MSCLVWSPAGDAYIEVLQIRAPDGRIYSFLPGVPSDVPQEDYAAVLASLKAQQGNMTSPAAPAVLSQGTGGTSYPITGRTARAVATMRAPMVQTVSRAVLGGGRQGGQTRAGSRSVALPIGDASTTYTYEVVPVGSAGDAQPSPTTSTTRGPATLSTTLFNQISWVGVPHATGYKIVRTAGGATQGLIGTTSATATSFQDIGQTATTYTAAVSQPPAALVVAGPTEL